VRKRLELSGAELISTAYVSLLATYVKEKGIRGRVITF
jgi:hypothetical protein